jgi:4-hydroxythreonine-4-phosphate dehydrogenase
MTAPIALTCGEPAGIGPELAAMAWERLRTDLPFFLIGDPAHLPSDTPVAEIAQPSEALTACAMALPVLSHPFPGPRRPGSPDPAQAQAVIDVIARGVGLVQEAQAAALCTAPIHKKALQTGAGFAYPGHTEYLAALANGADVVMMLASPALRVVPATIHVPLSQVPHVLTPELLEKTIRITHAALILDFGIKAPRVAVSGLNPHAGEGGTMGQEETRMIAPLIDRLRREGINLTGPLSADTMFHDRARETYDAAICMYHDQALIPIKTLDFDRGVNVTLGLPFIRTSPDHGTALDIAGKGASNPSSMIEALRMAQSMARARATQA